MKPFRSFAPLCAALALMLAGCLPVTTKSPVGTTVGLGADPALIGTWMPVPDKDTDDGAPGYFHFFRNEDGTLAALLVSTGNAKKTGEWSLYRITTARIGGRDYMNVRAVSDNGKTTTDSDLGNIPINYRLDDDGTLSLYLIDEDAAKAAIASGAIEGEAGKDKSGDAVLTASPEKLDAFLASEAGQALFRRKLAVLRRAP